MRMESNRDVEKNGRPRLDRTVQMRRREEFYLSRRLRTCKQMPAVRRAACHAKLPLPCDEEFSVAPDRRRFTVPPKTLRHPRLSAKVARQLDERARLSGAAAQMPLHALRACIRTVYHE